LKYWQREPVLGFGVGSHSFDGAARYANHPKLDTYLRSLEEGASPIDWRQTVSNREGLQETLFLGLRLNRGLDWPRVRTDFGAAELAEVESSLNSMCAEGLLEWKDSSIRLTPRGMLLSNEVFQEFI
ncbi:MAG: radical SAM family heme chaperone HemW, partial [Gammaproteobacteria bacterium]